jgi:hypothetical protein
MGITALDITMVIAVMLTAPAIIWPVVIAALTSLARVVFATRTLRSVLVG